MVKVLLDTDIGSDVDDAVALAYLLAHPDCELMGITTVTGNTVERAACAEALCEAAGARVHVRPGLAEPLLRGAGQPDVPHYPAVAHLSRPRPAGEPAPDEAIELLRETIRAHPGEIELLSIGPLTNIAVLFALDPELPSLLRGFTSMAGCYFDDERAHPEWNMAVDPGAGAMTYRRAPRGHRCIGLDVTRRLQLGRSEVEERFSHNAVLRLVLDMARIWFEKRDDITFHDPLAAALVFEPSLCTFETGKVSVAYGHEREPGGFTRFTIDTGGRHRVATEVDAERFFAEYFSRTTGQTLP